jgi:hypothetical protein
VSVCESCLQQLHHMKALRTHKVVPVPSCDKHDMPMAHVCTHCKVTCCAVCRAVSLIA